MSNLPRLSILIVSYNTRELTLACLRSLARHPPHGEHEVMVVDNASTDGSLEAIRADFPNVKVLPLAGNLGFARANNLAMREAAGEVFVLLNSDTELHANSLTRLAEAFAADPELAAAGGKLLNSDGSLQFGLRYDPRVTNALSEGLFLHRLLPGPWFGEVERRPSAYASRQRAEWLSGAYLAVRREWWERVGGLDSGFFMYSEDADWCRRIREAGGRVEYLPESVVTHHGGGSSSGSGDLHVIRFLARDRYARLHFSPARALAYRLALALGLALRAAFALPLAPFGSRIRNGLVWRARAAWLLFADPLPLEPHHD
ncbi:MAG: hypothetical protein GHCLOJNM_01648 [bacterium]|nr:hypothetical protein [bacterium]